MGPDPGSVHRVIQELGGQITIDSELGQGTTITITPLIR